MATEGSILPHLLRRALEEREAVVLEVFGTSMVPLIPPGAEVEIARCRVDSLEPGAVVALERGGHVICHVLVRVEGSRVRTLLTRGVRVPTWILPRRSRTSWVG